MQQWNVEMFLKVPDPGPEKAVNPGGAHALVTHLIQVGQVVSFFSDGLVRVHEGRPQTKSCV